MNKSYKSKFFAVLIIACGLMLASCESNRWFQSEDSLNAKIQTTWKKIKINSTYPNEQWTFLEGNVTRVKITPDTTITDHGTYSISTSLSKAYLNITGFTVFTTDGYNAEWEILELDGGILFIATDNGGSGVKQLEFEEQ
jgi:hypothetical protein